MNLCIIDFEATCDENNNKWDNEIIEFGCVFYQLGAPGPEFEFQSFVRPVKNPALTRFCTKLTGITQRDVDAAGEFPDVLNRFNAALAAGLGPDFKDKTLFASWGYYDFRQLKRDCKRHKAEFPFHAWHLNIKQEYLAFYKQTEGYLGAATDQLGIEWVGKAHRGIDDAGMANKVLKRMVNDGYQIVGIIEK